VTSVGSDSQHGVPEAGFRSAATGHALAGFGWAREGAAGAVRGQVGAMTTARAAKHCAQRLRDLPNPNYG